VRSFLYLITLAACATALAAAQPPPRVFFSPRGGCTGAIVEQLGNSKTNVFVQAYSFTSAPIAKALVDASKRGVKVAVILDKSQQTEKYSSATFLANNGIAPLIDARHAIAHNKIMIIDNHIVITGSFNFTAGAEEKNAENLLVIDNPELAGKYLGNWQNHWKHSDPYIPPFPHRGTAPRPRPKAKFKFF
jgi:phosphatidylserine/phosphatidylglycerophosphate/cardiolipin synthase-like enzyme